MIIPSETNIPSEEVSTNCIYTGPGFPMSHVVVFFVFSKWWLKLMLRVVDIGGIVG